MSALIVEVCSIDNVEHHPNADKLDIATVKGWNCIVGRGDYKPGDVIVFVPTDSIIPENLIEEYKLTYLRNGSRVRATKLRGFVSQGLILNIPKGKNWRVGHDVAKELGITKWEPPVQHIPGQPKNRQKRKNNPNFNKYTDIENIKHYNTVFQPGDLVVVTEKIHGANWRAGFLRRSDRGLLNWIKARLFGAYEFVYGSHNVQLTFANKGRCFYKNDPYGAVIERYNIKDLIPADYTLYGEVYGKGIQDLTYGEDEPNLVIFDVQYKGVYLDYPDMKQFCGAKGLPMAPELFVGEYSDELIKIHTSGKSKMKKAKDQIREGIVIRSFREINHPRVGRKILKSVSEDYLLRENGTEFR